MREVEAKAKVDFLKINEILTYMNKNYGKCKELIKIDSYFHKGENGEHFRIRQIDNKFYYNEKKRALENKFENNIETEREITREEAKEIKRNHSLFAVKTKREYLWKGKFDKYQVTLELAEIVNLGIFLEIEVLLEEDCPASVVKKAIKYINDIFKKLSLVDKIEKRKYIDMLFGY